MTPAATLAAPPARVTHAAILALVVSAIGGGRGGALAQGLSAGATVWEMAARDDVAGLARAINGGVPVNARDAGGETALHVAAREAHLFSAMMLIAKGANPNARDRQQRIPLHLAADGDVSREGERYQVVKLLVAKGSDRSAVDVDGKRPVDYARSPEFKRALAPPATSRPASRRPSRDSP